MATIKLIHGSDSRRVEFPHGDVTLERLRQLARQAFALRGAGGSEDIVLHGAGSKDEARVCLRTQEDLCSLLSRDVKVVRVWVGAPASKKATPDAASPSAALGSVFHSLGLDPSLAIAYLCRHRDTVLAWAAMQAAECGVDEPAQAETVEHGAMCDECGAMIRGVRYKCAHCAEFDLCSKCEEGSASIHPEGHVFLKIRQPIPDDSIAYTVLPLPDFQSVSEEDGPQQAQQPDQGAPLDAHLVADVSMPDGTVVTPGQAFVKSWCVRNTSATAWPRGTTITFLGGDLLSEGAVTSFPVPLADAGHPVTISVPMVAPAPASGRLGQGDTSDPSPGHPLMGYWRLAGPSGERFGCRLWVSVILSQQPVKPCDITTSATPTTGKNATDPDQRNEAIRMLQSFGFDTSRVNETLLADCDWDVIAYLQRTDGKIC